MSRPETDTAATPLVSIITVVKNGERNIRQTIETVLAQDYPAVEHIVIDGGSTDGTVDILRQYDDALACWVSEPDKGIADAMNKGVARARGDYVVFVHADDYFAEPGALSRVFDLAARCASPILAFNILFQSEAGTRVIRPRPYNYWTMFKNPFPHQGVFCRRELFGIIGPFDTSLRFTMDYDFFLKAYLRGHGASRFDYAPVVMRDNGISSSRDWGVVQRRLMEERRVHEKHCDSMLRAMLYRLHWAWYGPYRRLIGAPP
ncbi:MAG TPA: glycosyltransferase [Sedimenticola sp.]|nr:glycosyltransferase [Sedimenticola sp.]